MCRLHHARVYVGKTEKRYFDRIFGTRRPLLKIRVQPVKGIQ